MTPSERETRDRAERAEAAARDFAEALRYLTDPENWLGNPLRQQSTLHGHFTPYELARDALARHPSFSGEDGTEG